MDFISIFNDVLGPVMRGPSSSHTAGSYRIGRMARALLGEQAVSASFTFDPDGSYAKTYRQQNAHLGFAAGLLEWLITDDRFPEAMAFAGRAGLDVKFRIAPLKKASHPNTVEVRLVGGSGKSLSLLAQSTGGGLILITQIGGWGVQLTGKAYDLLIEFRQGVEPKIKAIVKGHQGRLDNFCIKSGKGTVLAHLQSVSPYNLEILRRLHSLPEVLNIWISAPVFYVQRGEALFSTSSEMVRLAQRRRWSLGRAALEYESGLLGLPKQRAMEEMLARWKVMEAAVRQGLRDKDLRLQLLEPSAAKIFKAEAKKKVAIGGPHARAAARAMAVLHVSNSGGVVCAAPTGASSGVIPGVLSTLVERGKLSPEQIALALFAASAVGLAVARRATFAAEVAGCQVEIGAAGAMAAAAVVESAGGSPQQAADAAAIFFQNSMGSVCDLVQGICEIPCHTRNAVAAASAFVCADLILGGYKNAIPLDETIDAVFAVGKMLPKELRCTSQGGIARTPSALRLRRRRLS